MILGLKFVIGDGFDYVARSRDPVDLLVLDLTLIRRGTRHRSTAATLR